jgi:hypothetical protein
LHVEKHADIPIHQAQVCSWGLRLQAELLEKIRELLAKRGRGERLEVFNHEEFPRFRDVVQYFSNEVRGVSAARCSSAQREL